MSATGLAVFDETLQVTHIWLKDLMERLETGDRHRAYLALRTVLHALRDRLAPDEAAHLSAQLPMLVRGFFFEGWRPSVTPTHERRRDEFLYRVRRELPPDSDFDVEGAVIAVFELLAARVAPGEIRKVAGALPPEIRELWPGT